MKKIKEKLKKNIILIISIIAFGIIFFAHNIVFNWDSSEYMGLASFIGTSKMFDSWISHRGLLFPLLLRICQPFGLQSKFGFLFIMYIFYLIMIYAIVKIYKNLKIIEFINHKALTAIFIMGVIVLIIVNPIIFAYFHIALAEFVGISMAVLCCYLSWKWIDTSYKKISVVILTLLTIFLYHIKQAYVVIQVCSILLATLISLIKEFKLKNFIYRIMSIVIIAAGVRIECNGLGSLYG